jgi:hypothetical protein
MTHLLRSPSQLVNPLARQRFLGFGTAPGGAAFVGALDAYESIIDGAWSVAKRLFASHTGALNTIRRSSGGEQDFSATDSGILDTDAADAYIGAGSGNIVRIYAQKSGLNAAQSTASAQPLYSSLAASFDGINDVLSLGGNVGTATSPSLFIALNAVSTGSSYTTVAMMRATRLHSRLSTNVYGTFTSADQGAGEALPTAVNQVISIVNNAGTWQIRRNGTTIATISGTSGNLNSYNSSFGADLNFSRFFQGSIQTVIQTTSSALNLTQIAAIENAIAWV